jgi:hypothetical protein
MIDKLFIYNTIDSTPNKDIAKNTTSKKFKQDLVDFFYDKKYSSMIEFGSWQGNSSLIFSYLFESVLGLELSKDNIAISNERCKDRQNVEFLEFNAYSDWKSLPKADVLNLDAMHDIDGVIYMITQAAQYYSEAIIVMDDYGHIGGTIKPVIDGYIENGSIEVIKWIGEDKGFCAANGKVFIDKEGLIFKFKI